MNPMHLRNAGRRAHQGGAVLVVGLIMLVVISLMGAVAYGVATQQERMSGNARDKLRAFEAAEASLRDCEAFISNPALVIAVDGSQVGVYAAAAATAPQVWQTVNFKSSTQARVLGTALAGVSAQPACVIEQLTQMEVVPENNEQSDYKKPVQVTIYRVTALGFGVRPETTAIVQSTFRRT
jgi:type IV pilus assembly protein PilX